MEIGDDDRSPNDSALCALAESVSGASEALCRCSASRYFALQSIFGTRLSGGVALSDSEAVKPEFNSRGP